MCRCFLSVQDMTEDSKTAGDPSQSEDGEDESTSLSDPSDEQPMGKAEAVEGKLEVTAAQPPRRVSTSPPPSLPVKLLTRLGSLDCEFTRRSLDVTPRCRLQQCLTHAVFPSQAFLLCQLRSPQPPYPGTSHFPKTLMAPCWEAGSPHLLGPLTSGHYTHNCPLAASLRNCTAPWPPNIDRTGQIWDMHYYLYMYVKYWVAFSFCFVRVLTLNIIIILQNKTQIHN